MFTPTFRPAENPCLGRAHDPGSRQLRVGGRSGGRRRSPRRRAGFRTTQARRRQLTRCRCSSIRSPAAPFNPDWPRRHRLGRGTPLLRRYARSSHTVRLQRSWIQAEAGFDEVFTPDADHSPFFPRRTGCLSESRRGPVNPERLLHLEDAPAQALQFHFPSSANQNRKETFVTRKLSNCLRASLVFVAAVLAVMLFAPRPAAAQVTTTINQTSCANGTGSCLNANGSQNWGRLRRPVPPERSAQRSRRSPIATAPTTTTATFAVTRSTSSVSTNSPFSPGRSEGSTS